MQSERLLIVLGHAQKGGLVVLHERLVYRALGIGSDAAEASVGHSELFEASLVEEYPVTEELELSALQVGGEIQERHVEDLLELLVVLVLSSALLIVSLFDILAELLGSIPLLLLQKRIVFLDNLFFESKRNLSGLTHQESRCFLVHHLVEAKLVDIY